MPKPRPIGHNGGPPLDADPPHTPPWGRGGFKTYFGWRRAHQAAWKTIPYDTMMRRAAKAEAIGVSYEDYQLEILERGRFLQLEDADAIAAIKARRRRTRTK